jgi:hypothetical protein
MADISDVEQAVAEAVTSILYPTGSSQSSIVGALCRVYRGWPNSATLNADLNTGTVNITIGADNDSGRTTTRYLPKWKTAPAQPGTVVSAENRTLMIAGSPVAGDVVGTMIDGVAFAYRVQTGDSPDLIAANLGQMIRSIRTANLQGCTVMVPGAASVIARVACDHAATFESRRQEKDLRIVCWCPTPTVRDAVATAIDGAINRMGFLSLPDSTEARVIYRNTASYDQAQNALLYRRDLIYTVEYATITAVEQPSMLFGASELNNNVTYG